MPFGGDYTGRATYVRLWIRILVRLWIQIKNVEGVIFGGRQRAFECGSSTQQWS